MRKVVTIVIGVAVLVLSPVAIWWSVTPHYAYGDAEMRAAVEGTWQVTTRDTTVTFTIHQAKEATQTHSSRGFVRSAAACSHRTMVKSAEACVDISEMPLAIAAVSGSATGTGMFEVVGTDFRGGQLFARLDDLVVNAGVAPDGRTTQATLRAADGHTVAATLVRITAASSATAR